MGDFLKRRRESAELDGKHQSSKICKKCMARQASGVTCRRCGGKLLEPASFDDPFIGTLIGDKYKLVEKLGAGGMGVVYRGINERLGQNVAVKFLHAKFASDADVSSRFFTEAKSYARVSHPNAVTLLEYGQHNQSLYIITEFIDGDSLSDVLRRTGPLNVVDCLHVALQICEVLSVAHSQGVIHRDLKPDNIMLTRNSRGRYVTKVLDFGIAKIADDEQGPVTQTGLVFGTPEFMSPEQARGWDAEPRSDLYALGIIMYYAVTGRLPFRGKNKLGILNKQINDQATPLSKVKTGLTFSAPFESVVERLLEKDPENRFESADALAEVLEQVRAYEMGDPVPYSMRLIESAQNIPLVVGVPKAVSSDEVETCDYSERLDLDDEEPYHTVNLGESDIVGQEFVPTAEPFDYEAREFDPGKIEIRGSYGSNGGSAYEEADNDSMELWREYPYSSFDSKRRRERRRMVLGIAVTLIAVFGASLAFWLTRSRGEVVALNGDSVAQLEEAKNSYQPEPTQMLAAGKGATDGEGSSDSQMPEPTMPQPSRTGLSEAFKGQIATIKQILESGDLGDAQKNLIAFTNQSSAEWNQDEKDAVAKLKGTFSDLRNWKIQVSESLEAKNCTRADEIRGKMEKVSAKMAAPYAQAVKNCMAASSVAKQPEKSAPMQVATKVEPPKVAPQKPAANKPETQKVAQKSAPPKTVTPKPTAKKPEQQPAPQKVAAVTAKPAAPKPAAVKQEAPKPTLPKTKPASVVAVRSDNANPKVTPEPVASIPEEPQMTAALDEEPDELLPSISDYLEKQQAEIAQMPVPESTPAFTPQIGIRPVNELPGEQDEEDEKAKKRARAGALPPKKI